MAENNTSALIEALLFISERPLSVEEIKKSLEDTLDNEEIRLILQELKTGYENSKRGIRIDEVAGGFRMVVAPELSVFLKKIYRGSATERLSKPALVTLAIIAYKQPVTKSEIVSLRRVNCDGVIKGLLEKELIRIAGRKKAPGRPKAYGTTRKFLECFGLRSLEELPLNLPSEVKDGTRETTPTN